GDWDFLYSDKKRIKKLERPSEGDEIVFHLDKEHSDFLERLDGLVGNDWWGSVRLHMKNLNLHNFLRNWQGSEYLPKNFRELREEKWQEFRGLVFENEEMFPSYILRVVGYQTLDDAVVNCNKGPLRKVDDGGFGPWQEEFHVRNPNHLFNLLRKSVDALEKKYLSSNTMRGLATVGDDIYFGTSKRELHRVVSVAESELITGVPRPVAKMISISLPVFDEGIRQRVLQNKRRRAYFAKRRKKVYKLAA
ncbi:hypothetical protein KY306_01390, partial [Candidatus Woesearchaeota archaeon]|nr:hypothetical protein [Candidatus Woesearchaeota archaeon]